MRRTRQQTQRAESTKIEERYLEDWFTSTVNISWAATSLMVGTTTHTLPVTTICLQLESFAFLRRRWRSLRPG